MPVIMRLAVDGDCFSTPAFMSPGYAGVDPWNDLPTAGAVGYRYVAGYAGCKMSKLQAASLLAARGASAAPPKQASAKKSGSKLPHSKSRRPMEPTAVTL